MKKLFIMVMVLVLAVILMPNVAAEDEGVMSVPKDFSEMLDELPDELLRYLPKGLFSDDSVEVADSVRDMLSPERAIGTVFELVGIKLSENLYLLEVCVACVLLSALFRRFGDVFSGKRVGTAFAFCTKLCIFSAVITSGYSVIDGITDYFNNLSAMMTAAVPIVGALYSIGGNVGAAASSSSGVLLSLSVCGNLCSQTVVPVFCVCLGSALVNVFSGVDMSSVSRLIKKTWLWVMGIISFVMTTAIGLQTIITARADSLGMKGAKYAVGSVIPVVGGTVAGTLGTLSASVSMIRSAVGIAVVVIIFLMLLPSVLSLIISRFVFMLSGTSADLLGCSDESGLFGELTGLFGYLIAAECIVSAVFIIQFAILAGCAAAY